MSNLKIYPDESEKCVHATHIYFWHDVEQDRPKTQYWLVYTKEYNDIIGCIHWFANWRCYSFFVEKWMFRDTEYLAFEKTCMRDILNFCDKLTKEHKSKRVGGNKTE